MNEKTHITAAGSTILGWIIMGTISFHFLERWSFINSFYFSVTTLTTVGFGDLHPTTPFSKLFTALYVLIGVGIVLTSLGIIGSDIIKERESKIIKRRLKKR